MGMRFIMAFNKLIAAKVAAYYTSWVDPQEFAECVERGAVSIQRHFLMPKVRFGFYAIGKGEKEFPLDELTDLGHAHHMHVVLPCDVINTEILDTLAVIESTREERGKEVDQAGWGSLNGKGIFELEVPEEISGDKVLTGKGVGGTIIGIVRNVLDSETKLMAQIKPGEIVVAVRIHTPELWSLCREVGGFITDEGGVSCNAAIFAREMEIPAVLGTGEATYILKDGQKVIVNGSHGAVYF